jgi:hypothetical protein
VDPLTVLCAVAAFVVYLPHGFDGALTLDLGIYGYGGQQVAEGVLPYVAVVNRVGPLADLFAGVGAFVSGGMGIDEVLGMRLVFMMLSITCIVLVYLLARELFSCRLLGVVAAAALLSFQGFIDYATNGPREKTAMVVFVLASLLALTHQRWLTTGVLISLATLVWQPAFFALIFGTSVAILLGTRRQDWRPAFARVSVGGAIPLAVVLATYAAAGELSAFLDCFIVINAFYTHQPSFLTDVPASWDTLVSGYGASLWILLFGLTGLMLLAFRTLRSQVGPMPPQTAALIGTAVFGLVSMAWTVFAYNNWPDTFVVLPAGAIGVAGLVSALSHRHSERIGMSIAAAVTAIATVAAVFHSIGDRDETLNRQRESVAAVVRILPDATILSVNAPQPLVLTGQRNASRLQFLNDDFIDYVDDTWPGGIDGYARWISRQKFTIIAVGGREIPPWLIPTTERRYKRMGYVNGWMWLVSRDVGVDRLHDLRRALDSQSWRSR